MFVNVLVISCNDWILILEDLFVRTKEQVNVHSFIWQKYKHIYVFLFHNIMHKYNDHCIVIGIWAVVWDALFLKRIYLISHE